MAIKFIQIFKIEGGMHIFCYVGFQNTTSKPGGQKNLARFHIARPRYRLALKETIGHNHAE